MSYSIVILSKIPLNASRCVMAIYQNEPELPRRNIIVVDDGARAEAEPNCPNITWVSGEKPFIFARNANIGIRHAFDVQGSDTVILLNDDAMLKTKRGFTSLVDAQKRNPQYGLLASSCNNVGNESQQPQGSNAVRHESRMLCFVCVAISREAWEKAGPLDEIFTGYGFDDDAYSFCVRRAGFKLGVWDGCFVDHATLPSTFRGVEYPTEAFEYNRQLFNQKYGA